MRTISLLLAFTVFIISCSPSKKSTSGDGNTTSATTSDNSGNDGSSFEKAIVINESGESKGVAAEYKWVRENYPGSTVMGQSLGSKGSKHYDILKIKTSDGKEKQIFFDITNFFGKF